MAADSLTLRHSGVLGLCSIVQVRKRIKDQLLHYGNVSYDKVIRFRCQPESNAMCETWSHRIKTLEKAPSSNRWLLFTSFPLETHNLSPVSHQAFPYSVPPFLPAILAFLCTHGREKEPIKVRHKQQQFVSLGEHGDAGMHN